MTLVEPDKQPLGDGSDHYGEAVRQIAKAARQIAAGTTKAVGSTAAAQIAAGTAAGGPWGAVLSAAWSLRHTLFKVLVCVCLSLLVLVTLIVSLPGVFINGVLGLDRTEPAEGETLMDVYSELSEMVSVTVDNGYNASLARVEQIIADGGYDYELSIGATIDYAQGSEGFDVSYILAAYSASLKQQGVSAVDMTAKLNKVSAEMFPVTYEEKKQEHIVPMSYQTYRSVNVTVVTGRTQIGAVNGVPRYRYDTEEKIFYLPDGSASSAEEITVPAYSGVTVDVPVYAGSSITGTRQETYYEPNGDQTLTPETETIRYVECTIYPFDQTVIASAFGIDLDAEYEPFTITYGAAILNMASALNRTLFGTAIAGQAVPLTDAELIAFVNRQSCNATRKHILTTALSLVGKVPYFWGGKSGSGWNAEWNTPKLVTAIGSSSTGSILPYGLDCSGFSRWVYLTAMDVSIGVNCDGQYPNTYAITTDELLPGDLGFLADDDGWGHVLIFAGYSEEGKRMWVHSTWGSGVVLNTPSYENELSLRRLVNVDYDTPAPLIPKS